MVLHGAPCSRVPVKQALRREGNGLIADLLAFK